MAKRRELFLFLHSLLIISQGLWLGNSVSVGESGQSVRAGSDSLGAPFGRRSRCDRVPSETGQRIADWTMQPYTRGAMALEMLP